MKIDPIQRQQFMHRLRPVVRMLSVCIAGSLVLIAFARWYGARRIQGYDTVVFQVQTGQLKADKDGDILLPRPWRWLTKNGHVYQTYDKQAGLALLFPTDVDTYKVVWPEGKTTTERDIAGVIYCSGTLPSDGWFTFSGMHGVSVWNDRHPARPHWFHVEPFYSD